VTALSSAIQRTLENVYRIDAPASVEDFALRASAMNLLLGPGSETRREAFLVSHDGEHTDVGLYLNDAIVEAAERFVKDAAANDDPSAIDAFCVAVEGVSHFLYFTYCGTEWERGVSQIELELQAEVDKYLVLRLLFNPPDLVRSLFSEFRLDHRLSEAERERYVMANRHARRYASWVDKKFRSGDGSAALADARALYRKPLGAKLAHIATAA